MKRPTITRRSAFGVTAFSAASMMLDLERLSSAESQPSAPASGLLKQRMSVRTINVHTHIHVQENSRPQQPIVPDAEITAEEKQDAEKYFARELFQFDTESDRDKYARQYINGKKQGRGFDSFENSAGFLLKEMDEAGIDTSVLLILDLFRPFPGLTQGDPNGERIRRTIESCSKICEKHPNRFIPFIGIDVRREKEGLPLLELAVKDFGFQGAGEFITTMWRTKPNDPLCYPYYEKCMELGIPAMIDCTMPYGYSDPSVIEPVVKDFPELRICLGGAGVRVKPIARDGQPPLEAYDEILRIAEQNPNVWLDLDDWQVADRAGMKRYLGYLRRALDGPARTKIMYGSDYPVLAWMYSEKEWIERILASANQDGLHFTADELKLFFSDNAHNFLAIKKT